MVDAVLPSGYHGRHGLYYMGDNKLPIWSHNLDLGERRHQQDKGEQEDMCQQFTNYTHHQQKFPNQ